jgi:hypothetical protein
LASDTGPLWIDNVNLTSMDITESNPDDSILFFFNDTEVSKTYFLPTGVEYIDVREVSYSGSVTLTPFTSVILLFNGQIPIGVSSENTAATGTFVVYPNPADGAFVIGYHLVENGSVKIALSDAMGREVMQVASGEQSGGEHQISINTAQLPGGVYFVKMNVNGKVTAKRLIVRTD